MGTNVEINWLLDFYGAMLTDRQKSVMEMHYCDDLSLSEISEQLNITRQAVHDSLKRGEKLLKTYEYKLKLVDRYLKVGKKIESIATLAKSLNDSKELCNEIKELKKMWD